MAIEGHGSFRIRRGRQTILHALRAAEEILRQDGAWKKRRAVGAYCVSVRTSSSAVAKAT